MMPWRLVATFAGHLRDRERAPAATAREPPQGTRRRLLETVHRSPGLPMMRLAALLGVAEATVYHHVERLERMGQVRTVKVLRRRLVFPPDTTCAPGEAERLALLEEPAARLLAFGVLAHPGLSGPDLQARIALSRRAFYHQLRRLHKQGLIHAAPGMRYHRLVAAPDLLALLSRIEEGAHRAE